ncbi:MAG: hypothetical protein QW231_05300 [Candidatus Bathyarchaeia archaeon]
MESQGNPQFVRLSPRFRVAQVSADNPFAAHGKGGLVFELEDWPGERFTLWFPESINAFGLPLRLSVDWMGNQRWRVEEAEEYAWQFEESELCEFQAEIRPIREGLKLTLTLTNLTSEVFRDGWVNICLRCCHAPSFNDPGLMRTFLRFKGEWTPIKALATLDHSKQYRIILPKEYSENFLRICGGMENAIVKQRPDHHLIAITDPAGKRTVGFYAEKCAGLVVNGMEDMRCIHSNPSLPYEIKPRETGSAECLILFMNEGNLSTLSRRLRSGSNERGSPWTKTEGRRGRPRVHSHLKLAAWPYSFSSSACPTEMDGWNPSYAL